MRSAFCAVALLILGHAEVVAEENWSDHREYGRFFVRSEFPIDRVPKLNEFLRKLPEHEADIAATLGLQPGVEPIVINVLEDRRSYARLVSREAPEGIRRQALFVRGENYGRIYVYLHKKIVTDLRHESTHAVLHSILPFVPLWLDEGLAEYFEVPRRERVSGHPTQGRVKLSAKFGLTWNPNLKQLESKDSLSDLDSGNYREAWAWIHFLLHGPEHGTVLLKRYLATIQSGRPPGPFSAYLRRIIPDPEANLTAHLKSWK